MEREYSTRLHLFPKDGDAGCQVLAYPGTTFLWLGWLGLNGSHYGSNSSSCQAWPQLSQAILPWLMSPAWWLEAQDPG